MNMIRIGTRGSQLALAQAEMTEKLLASAWPGLCIRREVIRTTGDARLDVSLKELHAREGFPADKGAFTKELETALEAGVADVAVHSLKDVPTLRPGGLEIVATLPRAAAEDVLLTKAPGGWEALRPGNFILTGSPRRERQIRWLRPDLNARPIRGNVPTRLRKFLDDDSSQGLILARAGLERLGFTLTAESLRFENRDIPCSILPLDEFPHAVGQAIIGLEIRANDNNARRLLEPLNHAATFQLATMERTFLRLLDAGCHTPVGVSSRVQNGRLHLKALVFDEARPNLPPWNVEVAGDSPEETAQAAFDGLGRSTTR